MQCKGFFPTRLPLRHICLYKSVLLSVVPVTSPSHRICWSLPWKTAFISSGSVLITTLGKAPLNKLSGSDIFSIGIVRTLLELSTFGKTEYICFRVLVYELNDWSSFLVNFYQLFTYLHCKETWRVQLWYSLSEIKALHASVIELLLRDALFGPRYTHMHASVRLFLWLIFRRNLYLQCLYIQPLMNWLFLFYLILANLLYVAFCRGQQIVREWLVS